MTAFGCDQCQVVSSTTVRWNCQECYDFDLCTDCYTKGHHALTHPFFKISPTTEEKVSVAPRAAKSSTVSTTWFCDSCLIDIRDVRYQCSVCHSYDLCQRCYVSGEHVMSHPFKKITSQSETLEAARIQSTRGGAAGMIAELCLEDSGDRPNIEMDELSSSHEEYCMVENMMKKSKTFHVVNGHNTNPHYNVLKVTKIRNLLLWKKYRNCRTLVMKENKGDSNEAMLFHGSPHVNDIVNNGFDERRGSGMFGYGTYFARNSSKSNLYVFGCNTGCSTHKDQLCCRCTRKMLFCRVTLGKIHVAPKCKDFPHPPVGFNSVMGKGGQTEGLRYDEFVIYRGEQAYPAYIIEYKMKL